MGGMGIVITIKNSEQEGSGEIKKIVTTKSMSRCLDKLQGNKAATF